jgi:serine/threonine protein kinase/WD40 repeat protein
MTSSSNDRNPLDRLAEEFVERFRKGERPALTVYCEQYPELAEEIRDLFPALVEMEQLKPQSSELTGDYVASSDSLPDRIGEFRIVRELGRGGMGVVYEAVQGSLGRPVALKVLPASNLLEPNRLERFRREARAAANLHHTNIVPVFSVGESEGLHYYAMQLIRGHTLTDILAEIRRLRRPDSTPVQPDANLSQIASGVLTGDYQSGSGETVATHSEPSFSKGDLSDRGRIFARSVAQLGLQAARALEYAHAQNLVHRDIKPSNLMLDQDGTLWVTDFGLAKFAEGDDLTRTGDIVGTLRYLPPERFEGEGDHRGDLFALGLTLYELLTQRPAYDATSRAELVEQVIAAAPPSPRSIQPEIPRDLETIVLKCMARDPEKRYASAKELGDDLFRFIEDRPIEARRIGSAERAYRWCRRNRTVAALMFTVGFLLLFATIISLIVASRFSRLNYTLSDANQKISQQSKRIEAALNKETDALNKALEANDLGNLRLAGLYLERGLLLEPTDPNRSVAWLAEAMHVDRDNPERSLVHRRRVESYLQSLPVPEFFVASEEPEPKAPTEGPRQKFSQPSESPPAIWRFSPDERYMVVLGRVRSTVWDLRTREVLLGFKTPEPQRVFEDESFFEFDPFVAYRTDQPKVWLAVENGFQLWNLAEKKPMTDVLPHVSTLGRRVGLRFESKETQDQIIVFDLQDGREISRSERVTGAENRKSPRNFSTQLSTDEAIYLLSPFGFGGSFRRFLDEPKYLAWAFETKTSQPLNRQQLSERLQKLRLEGQRWVRTETKSKEVELLFHQHQLDTPNRNLGIGGTPAFQPPQQPQVQGKGIPVTPISRPLKVVGTYTMDRWVDPRSSESLFPPPELGETSIVESTRDRNRLYTRSRGNATPASLLAFPASTSGSHPFGLGPFFSLLRESDVQFVQAWDRTTLQPLGPRFQTGRWRFDAIKSLSGDSYQQGHSPVGTLQAEPAGKDDSLWLEATRDLFRVFDSKTGKIVAERRRSGNWFPEFELSFLISPDGERVILLDGNENTRGGYNATGTAQIFRLPNLEPASPLFDGIAIGQRSTGSFRSWAYHWSDDSTWAILIARLPGESSPERSLYLIDPSRWYPEQPASQYRVNTILDPGVLASEGHRVTYDPTRKHLAIAGRNWLTLFDSSHRNARETTPILELSAKFDMPMYARQQVSKGSLAGFYPAFVEFSPDGRRAMTRHPSGVKIWNLVELGLRKKQVLSSRDPAKSDSFPTPEGNWKIVSPYFNRIPKECQLTLSWYPNDTDQAAKVAVLPFAAIQEFNARIEANSLPWKLACFSPSGKEVVLCGRDLGNSDQLAVLAIWNREKSQSRLLAPGLSEPLWEVERIPAKSEMNPSTKRIESTPAKLALRSGDLRVLFDPYEISVSSPLPKKHQETLIRVALSPDGRTLFARSDLGRVRVWRLIDGDWLAQSWQVPPGSKLVEIEPDGKHLWYLLERKLERIEIATGQNRATIAIPEITPNPQFASYPGVMPQLDFLSQGRLVLYTQFFNSTSLLQVDHHRCLLIDPQAGKAITPFIESRRPPIPSWNGEAIYLDQGTDAQPKILGFRLPAGEPIPDAELPNDPWAEYVRSPDGAFRAEQNQGQSVRVYNSRTQKPITPPMAGATVHFSADRRFVSLGSGERIFDLHLGQPVTPEPRPISGMPRFEPSADSPWFPKSELVQPTKLFSVFQGGFSGNTSFTWYPSLQRSPRPNEMGWDWYRPEPLPVDSLRELTKMATGLEIDSSRTPRLLSATEQATSLEKELSTFRRELALSSRAFPEEIRPRTSREILFADLRHAPNEPETLTRFARWLIQEADQAHVERRFSVAIQHYQRAFDLDSTLKTGRDCYNFACSLLRESENLPEPLKATSEAGQLRRRAYDWLKQALELEQQSVTQLQDRIFSLPADLQHWTKDRDLASIRVPALEMLDDPGEREAWKQLWDRVEAVRTEAIQKRPYEWTLKAGELHHRFPGNNLVLFGDPNWTDITVELETQRLNPRVLLGLLFRVESQSDWSGVAFKAWTPTTPSRLEYSSLSFLDRQPGRDQANYYPSLNSQGLLQLPLDGLRHEQPLHELGTRSTDWNRIRIEIRSSTATVFVNGTAVLRTNRIRQPRGQLGLWSPGESRFRNLKVIGLDGKILWDGWTDLPKPAKATEKQKQ